MTQLLDPAGPFQCIWDDTMPCEVQPLIILNADGTPMSEADLLAVMFNGYEIPPAPIPLPAGGVMLLSALAIAAVLKWRRA